MLPHFEQPFPDETGPRRTLEAFEALILDPGDASAEALEDADRAMHRFDPPARAYGKRDERRPWSVARSVVQTCVRTAKTPDERIDDAIGICFLAQLLETAETVAAWIRGSLVPWALGRDPLQEGLPYSPRSTYKAGDRIAHRTFGDGVVTAARGKRITVAFADGEKTLTHTP